MANYFIRRFLLMIPTFIGITFLCFTVTRYVPGGPVEQAILRYKMIQAETGEAGPTATGDVKEVDLEPMIARLKEIYGFDRPLFVAYSDWLYRVVVHQDLGESFRYSEPVWCLIKKRFPISLWFGLTGFILSYLICIPLGVWKAVKHGSGFDTASSVIVFIAYSIPGWAAGIIMLILLGGGSYFNLMPLGGVNSLEVRSTSKLSAWLQKAAKVESIPTEIREKYPELRPGGYINSSHPAFVFVPEAETYQLESGKYDDLSMLGKFFDSVWHMILPVFCYVLGLFATKTVLMKNSLMENLGQDYVRTAFAKGLSENVVIFKHALRNSLIPIATGLGHMLSLILAGSYLIERVFNINGFGYLGYESLIERDYPVTLGILVIGSLLRLFGNIFADILYCVIDPRIRFS